VDIYEPYLRGARKKWGKRLNRLYCEDLQSFVLSCHVFYDGVILIDTLEHLDRLAGETVLGRIQHIARRRVVVFSPVGDQPQSRDTYDLGGDYWQTHRSIWIPQDLRQIGFDVAVWEHFHGANKHAMFGIWERP